MACGGGIRAHPVVYLFEPHNEHIIATSKLLYLTDYWLFGLSNLPLVLVIFLLQLVNGLLLSNLALPGTRPRNRFAVGLLFAAAAVSFANWENLLEGFQTQFSLVILSALACMVSCQRYAVHAR
jgi:hypothetical protein